MRTCCTEHRGQRQAAVLAGTQRDWAAAELALTSSLDQPRCSLPRFPTDTRLPSPQAELGPRMPHQTCHHRPDSGLSSSRASRPAHGRSSVCVSIPRPFLCTRLAPRRLLGGVTRVPQSHVTCWGRDGSMASVSGLALPSSHRWRPHHRPVNSSSALASQSRCWKLRLAPPCHLGWHHHVWISRHGLTQTVEEILM